MAGDGPFAEIQENEFNLNIPRYVDTFEPEPEIDIPAVQKEIAGLEKKREAIRAKMDSYLKEPGYSKRWNDLMQSGIDR